MLSKDEAFRLTRFSFEDLAESAGAMRDDFSKTFISYSPMVSLPLTHICQQNCPYCSNPDPALAGKLAFLSLEDLKRINNQAVANKCCEAQISFFESTQEVDEQTAFGLVQNGFNSPIEYLAKAAGNCLVESGLLPHVNPRAISDRELRAIKEVSVSQGMLLGTIAGRLSEPGGPLFGIPGKSPARRLATLEAAGRAQIPFSTGVSVGIGDTRHERIEALLTLRDLNTRYGHIQEIVIDAYQIDCTDEEFLWSIAASRLIFENTTHIQAQCSSPKDATELVRAGIDDLGAISPSPDVLKSDSNRWRFLEQISENLSGLNRKLRARAAIYPEYISKPGFVAHHIKPYISKQVNQTGYLVNDPAHAKSRITLDLTKEEIAPKVKIESKKERVSNFPTSRPKR